MRRLWQSMPLRLSLGLVALFTVVSLASLTVSYFVARSSIEATIEESLIKDVAGFRAAPSAGAVAALVEAQGRAMDPVDRVVGYQDAFGRRFGNGAIVRTEAGFEIAAINDGDDVSDKYFALTEPLHGGFLTLAVSMRPRDALRQTMVTVLLVSLLPTVLIALGGGLLIARRSAARLATIEGTLKRLTTGDLSARVPALTGPADDLSVIGSRIDAMAEAQEESVSALRQVSSDIAHDLKTPIQRVAVLLERAAVAAPDAAEDLIGQARAETKSIADTFQALLQIAHLESSSDPSRFEQVDLGQVASDIVDLYLPTAEEQGADLTLEVQDPKTVKGDARLIGQLLANLIENSLRYAGESPSIAVTVKGNRLSVADRGPGIPEDKRQAVLKRLYRLESSRGSPGSGLGLALVKAIAKLHGADLTLNDNAPGLVVHLDFADNGS